MSRTVTLAGYAVVAVAAILYQLAAMLGGRTSTLGQTLGSLRRSAAGRVVLLAGWLWLGWHLFVRGAWR